MPKLDIEKEHEAIKAIEDALIEVTDTDFELVNGYWETAKEILIYLKVRGYEVVKRGS